jgi:hypothetical protein
MTHASLRHLARRAPSVLVAASLLAPAAALAAELERHPYLQSATPTSIIVVWTTLADSTGAVEVGPAPDQLDTMVASGDVGTQHEVALTGLRPDTRYYYRVLGDGAPLAGDDEAHGFRTPPPVGTRTKLRAWIVGDSGTGNAMQAQVRDAMLQHAGLYVPHLFLHMGDMAYSDGTYDEFTEKFYAPYADVMRSTPVWPTLGNHEGRSSDSGTQSGPYYGGYVLPTAGQAGGLASGTEAYYSFDYANVHFLVLDSHDSPREPDGAMLTWALADLMATEQEWIIAYWHHPPYTKGSHDSDTEGQLVDMRENALPILEAAGVDLVLGGHSHIYERSYLLDGGYQTPSVADMGVLDASDGRPLGDGPYAKPPGVTGHEGTVYVVAGHGGTGVELERDPHPLMFFTEVENGSCLLDVQGNRLSVINVRFDGQVTDRVSIIKGDGVVVASPDGGEVLVAGHPHELRWATVGTIPQVRLEYSLDDGASWSTIEASIPNTGSHAWDVPVANTQRALVRVSDARDATLGDESNAGFTITSQIDVPLVDFGHTWRYHDQGVDLGEAWLAADYDDSAWPEGPGQLGYGDGDEATELLDADPNHPSAYFRTVVELPEGEPIGAELTALFDDAVAVWINGELVFGVNVDDGTDYGTWASAGSDNNEIATASVDVGALVTGSNVITAMAKQSSESSSDLSFDLRLVVTVQVEPPPGVDETGGASTSSGPGPGLDDSGGLGGSAGSGALDGTGASGTGGLTAGATDGEGGCGCGVTGSGSRGGPGGALIAWLLLFGASATRGRPLGVHRCVHRR